MRKHPSAGQRQRPPGPCGPAILPTPSSWHQRPSLPLRLHPGEVQPAVEVVHVGALATQGLDGLVYVVTDDGDGLVYVVTDDGNGRVLPAGR
jgi:hypothetical protein